MRGIPNVGVYLDGIWQVSNNGLLTRDFVELERIEVLRGPQRPDTRFSPVRT